MRTADIDTRTAPNAWSAARDARIKNVAMGSTYSAAERLRAGQVGARYSATESHINYRQRFIAIKLSNATVRDRQAVKDLESFYAAQGIEKRVSARGIIYRIPRAVA